MTIVKSIIADKNEQKIFSDIANNVYFHTSYQFLLAHNGLRPGCFHSFLAPTGSGKSTLTRSIIINTCLYNMSKKVTIWLSEESVDDLRMQLSKKELPEKLGSNTCAISEVDLDVKQTTEEYFFSFVEKMQPDVLFFDNITTSFLYSDKKPSEQSKFILKLKAFVKNNNIACVIFAHTGSSVSRFNKQLLTENDIRGSRTVVNITEFLYLIQQFEINDFIFSTIRTIKHRGQEVENRMHRLIYDKESSLYKEDVKLNFKDFKEAYDKSNRL